MYIIRAIHGEHNIVIYNDINPEATFAKLVNPELKMKANTAGSLTFTMEPGNIGYDIIKIMTTTIEVYKDGKWYWSGRPISVSTDFWLNKKVVCEGALAYLNDTVVPLHKFESYSGEEYISALLKYYRDHGHTSTGKRHFEYRTPDPDGGRNYGIFVSWVTSSDNPLSDDDYVVDGGTVLSYILDFADKWGLYIRLEKLTVGGGERFIISMITGSQPELCEQEINFGRNLLDYTLNYEWSDIKTVLHPLGAKLDTVNATHDEDYPDYTTLAVDKDSPGITLVSQADDNNENSGGEGNSETPIESQNDGEEESEGENENSEDPLDPQSDNEEETEEVLTAQADTVIELGSPVVVLGDSVDLHYSEQIDAGIVVVDDDQDAPTDYTWFVDGEYLINTAAAAVYGRIEETITWSEVDDKETLLELAKLYLSDYQYNEMKISVTAFDLHYIAPSVDSFELLERVTCKSKMHGLNTNFIVTEINIPFDKPENTKYSFSRNNNQHGADSSSAKSESKTISGATSRIESASKALKDARDHAAAIMDMNTKGYVSFITPSQTNLNGYPSGAGYTTSYGNYANRVDRIAEIWITDAINPDNAQRRWRWNVNGLAHQVKKNGVWQSPNVAITMDGAIVATYITTGILRVPQGDGEGIVPVNAPDVFYADMNRGECRLSKFTVKQDRLYSNSRKTLDSWNSGIFIGGSSGSPDGISIGSNSSALVFTSNYILGNHITHNPDSQNEIGYIQFNSNEVILAADTNLTLSVDNIRVSSSYGSFGTSISCRDGVDTSITFDIQQNENNTKHYTLEFRHGICINASWYDDNGNYGGDDGTTELGDGGDDPGIIDL